MFDLFNFIPTEVAETVSQPSTHIANAIIAPELASAISLPRTPFQIAQDNLAALRLLLELRDIPVHAHSLSQEECLYLLRYQGWGTAAEVFMDTSPNPWAELAQQVRSVLLELVGEPGYEASRHSVLTAFYTSPWLIGGIYRLLERMGLGSQAPLQALEPGCGTGLFMGMTPQWQVNWSGVEPDPVSSLIARRLYPQATIYPSGIEEADLPTEFYDLAVGNVPFMQAVPYDRAFTTWEFGGLHDYVIAKAISTLKPGGVAALLTSVGSLQSKRSQAFRERLSQQVRLITAIKLPMFTFWNFSRTQIGSDLLVFQRLMPGERGNSKAWVNLIEMPEFINPETEKPLCINTWFEEHPECVIGNWTLDKHYGSPRLTTALEPDAPTAEVSFGQMVEQMPVEEVVLPISRGADEGSLKQRGHKQSRLELADSISLPQELKDDPFAFVQPSSYVVWEGSAWQYRNGRLNRVAQRSSSRKRRIIGMCRIKAAVHRVLELQRQGCSDDDLAQAQEALSKRYDLFVRDYGALHTSSNVTAFGDDPDFPLLLSLEVWDADRPKETKKADIFTKRTIHLEPPRVAPRTAKEALVDCLAEYGKLDLVYMASRYGKSVDAVVEELQTGQPSPLIFADPKTERWITAEEYLSGNVKQKLEEARAAALINRDYYLNVRALLSVQPVELLPTQIYAQLGSAWLPIETIAQFVSHLLKVEVDKVIVRHNRAINDWDVDTVVAPSAATNTVQWGTPRITALRLIELALNQQAPVIYDSVWNPQRKDYDQIKNHAETRRALNRSTQIKQAFKRWIWTDAERTYELAKVYNDQFNSSRARDYDGGHLRYNLSGMSTIWQERLVNPAYHYQLDTCWRILVEGNTLGQIPVGGGKTAIMVVASQLLRQFGRCTKPAIVVPDHLVLQQAAEALSIYPGLRVLLIASELMPTPQKRRELINRSCTGTWDLIICSQTAFASIPIHPETVEQFQDEELDRLMAGWRDSHAGSRGSKRYLKDEERAVERYQAKVKARHDKMRRNSVAYFDHSGIDWLFVDESHDYLGLPNDTRITGVLGLGSSSSQRAQDLRYKTQFLAGVRGEGNGIVLMSGTPIRNTLGQAWVNLVYLMPHVLERKGLLHFDSFISVFAEALTQTEVTGAGTLDIKTRLANWSNLPEFRTLWEQVVHIIRDDQLQIKRPKAQYKTVEVPASPSQLRFFHWLASRVRAIKNHRGRPQKGDDNWCAVCSDTTMGVLDLRLLRQWKLQQFLNAEEIAELSQEQTKVEQCIQDVYESWKDSVNAELRRVQLIFCDTGTPHSSGRWTVYQHSKEELVEMGVPEQEIAFIHDAKNDQAKAELFARVREGKVRIIYASTPKLGVGTQIPDRLYQLRHLDCPKRPTDIWQRNGRIIRPGNRNQEVEIYFYVTTGQPVQITSADGKEKTLQGISPDSWLYELVRRKANFIEQGIFSRDNGVRTIEDIDEVSLDFATLMATATGDRRLIDKMNLDREVAMLLELESDWQVQQSIAQRQVNTLPSQIAHWQQELILMEQDLALARQHQQAPFELEWQSRIGKPLRINDPKVAAKKLWTWILMARGDGKSCHQRLGSYGNFDLWGRQSWKTELEMKSNSSALVYSINAKDSARGNLKVLQSLDEAISAQIHQTKLRIQQSQNELAASTQALNVPFEQAEQLQALLEKQAALAEELGLLDVELAS